MDKAIKIFYDSAMESSNMKTETKTDNELIAEFMGFEKTGTFYDTADNRHYKYKSEIFGYTYPGEWAFHIKWDWLMPVVERVESIERVLVNIYGDATVIAVDNLEGMELYGTTTHGNKDNKIGHVYRAVIEFIKWHNSQKQ